MTETVSSAARSDADLEPATVAERSLVPSYREQGLGVAVADYSFEAPDESVTPRLDILHTLGELARQADPRRIEGPKLPFVVVSLVAFNGLMDATALGNLMPSIQATFGLDLAFLLTLATVTQFSQQLIAPPMGWLADRVKRVWMARAGSVVSALSAVLQAIAPGVGLLAVARTVNGLGQGVSQPAGQPLLADYYGTSSRGRVFAGLWFFGVLGGTIGPTVSGFLAGPLGWRGTLLVLGLIALVLSLLTFLIREPRRGYLDRLEMGASDRLARQEQKPMSFAGGWRAAWSVRTMRRMWLAAPFAAVAQLVSLQLMPYYYSEAFGLSPAQRGVLVTIGLTVGLVGIAVAGPLTDRYILTRPSRIMTIAAVVAVGGAVEIAVLAVSPWLALSFAVTLPLSFAGVGLVPMQLALTSLVIPARLRGLGLATQTWFQLIGGVLVIVVVQVMPSNDIRSALWLFVPFGLLTALMYASAGQFISRDMRAALAANLAGEEAERAAAAGHTKLVVCRDLDVSYGEVQVLFNVDFDVEAGEIVALLGTNGAGKSTLLRAIAGVQQPSNGAIFVDSVDTTHLPSYEAAGRGVVLMPGGNAVFPTLSVEENLRAAAYLYRTDEDYLAERTDEVYRMFPVLAERRRQPAGNLSGGEQQMVGLAQALLMRPKLLMVDELSLGLAPKVVDHLLETLRRIHQQGTTIILVEQSLNVALSIAGRAVFMEKGEVKFSGPTEELLRRPDLIRAVFMGGRAARSRPITGRAPAALDEPIGPLLSVTALRVGFGGVQALDGLDLTVDDGEIVGLIGPNGAGKTTLFDVISGFVRPDAGRILLADEDVTGVSPDGRANRGLGRSFQNARLFSALTVRENLTTAMERRAVKSVLAGALWLPSVRRSERRLARRVDDLIELLGLEAYADKFLGELSTGTRRAVDMACVMAAEPKLLLLDEPSSGLAQAETEALGPVLLRLAAETGCGMLVIEHDLPLVTSISQRLVAMESGRVLASGPPDAVATDPKVLAAYLSATEDTLVRSDTADPAMKTIIATVAAATAPPGDGTHNDNHQASAHA
jgi:ABC-type branched-subunit amino acid transport system ATPase component/predicted MFS family arabinose efflux permease